MNFKETPLILRNFLSPFDVVTKHRLLPIVSLLLSVLIPFLIFGKLTEVTAKTALLKADRDLKHLSYKVSGDRALFSGSSIIVSDLNGIKLQNISSGSNVTLIAKSGNIAVGNISSGSDVTLIAKNGNITVGNVNGSRIELSSRDSIEGGTFGGVSTSLVKLSSTTSNIKVNAISAGASGGIVEIKAKGFFQATGTLKPTEFDISEQNPQVSIFAQTSDGSTSLKGGCILIQHNNAFTTKVSQAKEITIEGKGATFVIGPQLRFTNGTSGTAGGIYIGEGRDASVANKYVNRSLGSSGSSTTGGSNSRISTP